MKTITGTDIERSVIGYVVNAELESKNKAVIAALQQKLLDEFGDAVWVAPAGSLHITLLDWIAPLVDYGQDKNELYQQLQESYDTAMRTAIGHVSPITVTFDTISAFQPAIIVRGYDNGEFAHIRKEFVDNVTLLPNTKLPPTIIHSTIARFKREIEFEPLEEFVKTLSVNFEQKIDSFRLVRETIDPLIIFEELKRYRTRA